VSGRKGKKRIAVDVPDAAPRREDVDPDILQLPLERRPWIGFDEPARFMPERVLLPLPWLDTEDMVAVKRRTWDGFVSVLRREGYMALLKLGEQLTERRIRADEQVKHFSRLVDEATADLRLIREASKRHGLEAKVEGAGGQGGWERAGAVLWAPREAMEGRRIPLNVKVGKTWQEEVKEHEEEVEDREARLDVAYNAKALALFREDALGEVLRHFETYGVAWAWDEPGDESDLLEDPGEGARVPWSRRHTPNYGWIAVAFKEEQGKGLTDAKARAEVIERYRRAFEHEHRRLYGRYEELGDSTIRRACGEID
jgi:hypothetical protein